MMPESRNSGATREAIARQRLGKQIPAAMNTYATTEEPLDAAHGKANPRFIVKRK
jgi:hypothetical protein